MTDAMAPLVAIDADVLGRQRTGDERYVAALLREFGAGPGDLRFAALTRHPELVPPGVEAVTVSTPAQAVRMAWSLPRALRRLRPRVGHFQYMSPLGWRGRSVVTIHDLSFEDRDDTMSRADLVVFRTLVPRAARRADFVLTVSEFSRQRLIERYGLAAAKVVATPNGIDPAFSPEGPRHGGPPYVLFVGALQPRKDPVTAVETLARLDAGMHLMVVGPAKFRMPELRDRITALALTDRVHFSGHVGQSELAALYRGANCLLFPSRYEGFGLPLVESMACGTPVVAAATSAVPEVVGDAGVLVPPGDSAAMADGVHEIDRRRDELVRRGLDRARQFAWSTTAKRILDVYRELT